MRPLRAMDRAASGGGPTLIEAMCYRYGPHATADDPGLYRTKGEESAWREFDPVERMRSFLELNGWWDDQAEVALTDAATSDFDAALDAVSMKDLPERSDIVMHAFDKVPDSLLEGLNRLEADAGDSLTEIPVSKRWVIGNDRLPQGSTSSLTMAEAINQTLHQEMALDPTTLLLGQDVGVAGGVFRISEGLLDRFGEERVIDTPINESGIVGAAIGMAMAGVRPIAEIQFEGFCVSGVRPDRKPSRPDQVPHPRQHSAAYGAPHAERRRHRCPRASL